MCPQEGSCPGSFLSAGRETRAGQGGEESGTRGTRKWWVSKGPRVRLPPQDKKGGAGCRGQRTPGAPSCTGAGSEVSPGAGERCQRWRSPRSSVAPGDPTLTFMPVQAPPSPRPKASGLVNADHVCLCSQQCQLHSPGFHSPGPHGLPPWGVPLCCADPVMGNEEPSIPARAAAPQ